MRLETSFSGSALWKEGAEEGREAAGKKFFNNFKDRERKGMKNGTNCLREASYRCLE